MKQSKRALSMLLAILMALTTGFSAMLPAFAEEGNEAMIDGTEYATLGEAIEESIDGDTITLLRNLTLTATNKEIYKNITIDGGNAKYTITASDAYTFQFCDSFTLKNLKFQTTHGFRFWNTNRNGRTELVGTLENVEWTVSNALFANIQGEKSGVPQTLNIIDSKIANLSGKGDSLIATYNKGESNVTINIKNSSLTQNSGSAAFSNIGNRAIFYFHINSNVVLNLQGNSIFNYSPQGCAHAVHAFLCTKDAKVTVNADSSVGVSLLDSGAETAGNYFTYSTGSGTVTVNDHGAAWNVSAAIAWRGFYFPTSGSYDVNEMSKAVVEAGACCHGDTALTYRKAVADYAENGLSETERLYSGYSFKVETDYYKTWADALKAEGDIILIANAPHIDKQIRLAKDAIVDGQGKYVLSSSNYFFELVGHSATFRNLNLNVAKGIGTGTGDGAAVLFENCKIDVTGGLLLNIKAQTNVIFRNTTVVSTAADAAILLQAGATSEIKLMNSTIDYRKGNSGYNTSIINIASKSKGTVVLDGTSKLIYSPDSTGAYNQIIAVRDAETAATVHLKAGAVLEYNTVPKSTTSLAFLRSNASLTLVDEGATWKVSEAVAKKGYRFVNTSGTFNCKTVAMKTAEGKLYSPTEVIKLTAATAFVPVTMGVTNEAGASIRLDLPTGIRFGTQIDKTFYETLGASAVYGVRVARKDVLNGGSFAALTDANSVSYTSAKEGFRWVTEGEFFRTVLMNINEANYQTELSWSAFVTVTYADGKTATYYADYTEADNCRSLAHVASRALQDTTVTWTADETALLKTIAGIND
ncbi:MAG: hypothetical protein SOZ51_00445 [Eubacteriales bacterium]|nr:hypothetical protein [Eubacteriales bacterium]